MGILREIKPDWLSGSSDLGMLHWVIGGGIATGLGLVWRWWRNRGKLSWLQRREYESRTERALEALREINMRMFAMQSQVTPNQIALETLNTSFKAAQEEIRNAHEALCEVYLSGDYGRERFLKKHSVEIRQIVESEVHRPFYQEPQSKYFGTLE